MKDQGSYKETKERQETEKNEKLLHLSQGRIQRAEANFCRIFPENKDNTLYSYILYCYKMSFNHLEE